MKAQRLNPKKKVVCSPMRNIHERINESQLTGSYQEKLIERVRQTKKTIKLLMNIAL